MIPMKLASNHRTCLAVVFLFGMGALPWAIGQGAADSMEAAFDMFPVGKPWKEVRVPRYNDRDELTSMMHSETLTRESDQLLELDGLTLAMFQAERKMSLRLKTGSRLL